MEHVMDKQTALEWLQIALALPFEQQMQFEGLFQQALEMEKKQIIDAAADHCYPTCESARTEAEQYYNETYGK
jgi:hypothetical protein